MPEDGLLKIGSLAAQAEVNVQTVRYYERCGLLSPPQRTASGYRMYPPDSVRLLRFIKNAQSLGFTLAEIGELIRLRGGRRTSCKRVRLMIQAKIGDIETRLRDLHSTHTNLTKLIKTCRRVSPASACPIIGALDSGNIPGAAKLTRQRSQAD